MVSTSDRTFNFPAQITLDSAVIDVGSDLSFDNANDEIDINTTGVYEIGVLVFFDNDNQGTSTIQRSSPTAGYRINGSTVVQLQSSYLRLSGNSDEWICSGVMIESLTSGDTIEMYVEHTPDSPLDNGTIGVVSGATIWVRRI